jgi:hypothetical protein
MSPLETYLSDLYMNRSSGSAVDETSGYPALSQLFNEVGKTLKPRVRCIINIKNKGAGIPDGGFFTPDQFQRRAKGELIEGQLPSRGCIEVKPTSQNIEALAESEQVRKYLGRYRQVLLTNYRDFLLVGLDRDNNLVKRERFSLAANETDFWNATAHARATANEKGERFTEYLKRVMLHAAPLTQPKDVAWFLASYARDARIQIESSELPALKAVREALEEALGLKFEDEKGERFFRSTFVQTLFYGVFSAWVLWSKKNPPSKRSARFNWHEASWSLHVPMIKALFEQVATPSKLKPLGLTEVLDWTADVLNRVDRAAFFVNFEEEYAVQYFYEPFLQAFDPELRKELGVWFTPIEIVKYMVARVDTVLREELDIADGLADSRVYVLDPCCGTGAYLVEVLHKILETLKTKGEDALAANDLKRAAMNRVFGFEILPAPFVVSHLQLGLLLQNLGAPLSESTNERVGVYLTNSLTGWQPPSEEVKARLKQLAFSFAELKEEHDAAERVKQETPILVILGNPPYNAFAGVSPEEEQGLVDPYKAGLISDWGIKKFNLDDLYVRFFRLAERRIALKEGIVTFISNFSYLRDPSFVVMRKRFLAEFDKLWFDSMNGDSRGTGKLTPQGDPDPSVFSTEYNREGIRVGTAIALMVRKNRHEETPTVRFRQFWGVTKRADLLDSVFTKDLNSQYQNVTPHAGNRFSFQYMGAIIDYLSWPSISDLSGRAPFRAFIEARRGALIEIDREVLQSRMQDYYNAEIGWDNLKLAQNELTRDAARFNAKTARAKVLKTEGFDSSNLRRYGVRPLETRWCYYSSVRPLWNEPRPELIAQCWKGNRFLVTRLKTEKEAKGSPIYFSSTLVDYQTIARNVSTIPLRLRSSASKKATTQNHFFAQSESPTDSPIANLSTKGRSYLKSLGIEKPDANEENATIIWMHVLAIGYSPAYLTENAEGIRGDWPRIPLPSTRDALLHSAELGRKIAPLLDNETDVGGVTSGVIYNPLKNIAVVSHATGGALDPSEDLKVTAGWGHVGKSGVTMPGRGKLIERDYRPAERESIESGATHLGLSVEEMLGLLGRKTYDVYLNDVAYWQNVPVRVWDYTIGGYQVMKKWLSYRELELLGRALTPEEAREVMNMARRIAAIILLEPALDGNYQAVKSSTYDWHAEEG